MRHVTWSQAVARRMQRQGLLAPLSASPAGVATALCGAHAQVLSAAEWSLGLRSHIARAEIHKALWEDHSLIKTIGPRGTVHLISASELPVWLGALEATPGNGPHYHPEARISSEQREDIVAAIDDALHDAELTVTELDRAVVSRLGAWAGDAVIPAFQTYWPRWRQAIGDAAFRGVLCFGPNRGRNVTYTNPRRWHPKLKPVSHKTAPAEAVRRYLRAYGPARPEHFARWFAVPPKWVVSIFDSLGDELERVDLDGMEVWILTGDTKFPAEGHSVHLLPYFDGYAVASHPRERLYPGVAARRAMARGQAGNFPVLLIDGIVAGVWHQRRAGRNMHITVEPFGKLSATQRKALDAESLRLAEFFGLKPALTIGKVSVGAHA